MAAGVLVVTEIALGKPVAPVYELLGLAGRLAAGTSGKVEAALLGRGIEGCASDLIARGAERVYLADEGALADYEPERWVARLVRIARESGPAAILLPHTTLGADLAPRLAFRLDTAVAAGCVEIARDSGRLLFTRPCYGGSFRETLSMRTAPAVATVRGGCHEAAARDPRRKGEVVRVEASTAEPAPRMNVVARERTVSDGMRLEEARVVVAGGRGLEGADGFVLLAELAQALGGAVGASRVPCDLGWCPHSMQIGLTGKTVAPEVYIAVGISGAGHHMAGCGNAGNIIAINTDREAAIYGQARWGLVGDYRQVIPPLIAAIREIHATARKSE